MIRFGSFGREVARKSWKGFRETLRDFCDSCAGVYLSSVPIRATVDATGALLVLILVDWVIGFQPALRILYMAPIWLAAQRGGKFPGFILVASTALALTIIEIYTKELTFSNWMFNTVLRVCVLSAIMLLIARLESRLQAYANMATRDSLTGLANRMGLQQTSDKMIEHSLRTGEPLTLVMIDCDDFKSLNDHFGHDFGDQILKTLGRLLRRTVPGAFSARTGGDEFIVLFPCKHAPEATFQMERLLTRFEDATLAMGRKASLSFGVACFVDDGITLDRMLLAADKDMYLRKGSKKETAVVQISERERIA